MESNNNFSSIEIPNYSGPLEALLELAKTQKVDLAQISITKLADQFLNYIQNSKDLDLEKASEYLVMSTWLAYLKSKLLLPEDDEENFKALEVAEKLKLQLKKLELIRLLSDQLLNKKRIGRDLHYRGMKGGIKSINTPIYDITLYELLKTYANINMQKAFQTINIPKLPVFTAEEGVKVIKEFYGKLIDWKKLDDLIPKNFKKGSKFKRTGKAGIFAGSLELVKEGNLKIKQENLFDDIYIRESK